VAAYSKRVGDSLFLNISFTCGTPTAVSAQISLGYNGTSGNVSLAPGKFANGGLVGKMQFSGSAATTTFDWAALGASTGSVLLFGIQTSTATATTAANGSAIAGTGQFATLFAQVPISGWSTYGPP
jgi:hypothetical protein